MIAQKSLIALIKNDNKNVNLRSQTSFFKLVQFKHGLVLLGKGQICILFTITGYLKRSTNKYLNMSEVYHLSYSIKLCFFFLSERATRENTFQSNWCHPLKIKIKVI